MCCIYIDSDKADNAPLNSNVRFKQIIIDTKIVLHYINVMKNITITLDEDVARWAKIHAAKQEKSLRRVNGRILNLTGKRLKQGHHGGRQEAEHKEGRQAPVDEKVIHGTRSLNG